MRHRKGFTLIELLVVIAIIAILAAILLPVFARARENARKSACQNNSKQIGVSIMQYTQDYDERTPNQWWYSGCNEWNGTPGPQLQPYIKSTQVFVCPSKGRGSPNPATTNQQSYGYNGLGFFSNRSLAQFEAPSELVAVIDAPNPWLDGYWRDRAYPAVATGGENGRFAQQTMKHMGFVNATYADGHSKAVRISSLKWGPAFGGVFTGTVGPHQWNASMGDNAWDQ